MIWPITTPTYEEKKETMSGDKMGINTIRNIIKCIFKLIMPVRTTNNPTNQVWRFRTRQREVFFFSSIKKQNKKHCFAFHQKLGISWKWLFIKEADSAQVLKLIPTHTICLTKAPKLLANNPQILSITPVMA